jgi:integrase
MALPVLERFGWELRFILSLVRQWSRKKIKPLKTKKSKAVLPIINDLALSVKEWKLQSKSKTWVFPARHGLTPMDVDYWYLHTYLKLLSDNHLPRVKLHSLRHSFASAAIDSGIKVEDLQKLMRHTKYGSTMDVYRHLLPKQLDTVLDKDRSYISAIRRRIRRKSGNFDI